MGGRGSCRAIIDVGWALPTSSSDNGGQSPPYLSAGDASEPLTQPFTKRTAGLERSFSSNDATFPCGGNSESNLVPANLQDFQFDLAVDANLFAQFTT